MPEDKAKPVDLDPDRMRMTLRVVVWLIGVLVTITAGVGGILLSFVGDFAVMKSDVGGLKGSVDSMAKSLDGYSELKAKIAVLETVSMQHEKELERLRGGK